MMPVPLLAAIYAKDLAAVARFYEQALGLTRLEEATTFVLLAGEGLELSVVQVPKSVASSITITEPPAARDGTPIRLSFLVSSIETVRRAVEGLGGKFKPKEAAWNWRGCLHLDGTDPEGNVFQVRQREA